MRPERFSPLSVEDASYLLADVERFEPDWLLVLPYVSQDARSAWLSVLGYAAEVLTIPARVSNPMLGAIRVAWWREALAEAFGDAEPRQHPVVLALASTLRTRTDVRAPLEAMLDALAPFLEPGDDSDWEAAFSRRTVLYGRMAEALSSLEDQEAGGEALALHALAKIKADPSAAATAEGPEPIARRFARGLAAKPEMADQLAAAITAYRREADKEQPLAALPFSLVRLHRGHGATVQHPLMQRWRMFRAVLTGSL